MKQLKLFVKTVIAAAMMLLAFQFVGRAEDVSLLTQTYSVSINADNISVGNVSMELTRQTAVAFSYSEDTGNMVLDEVRVSMKEASLESILESVFAGKDIAWMVKDNMIGLYRTEPSSSAPVAEPKVKAEPENAQQNDNVRLSGKITDANGNPLAAVAVYVPGTSGYYATSDSNGNFSINAPKGSKVTFSLLGYKDLTIDASENGAGLTISLEEEANFLEESVVVGYAVQKKSNLTGAVSSIKGDVLESRPVTDVSHALQGVSPGLNISVPTSGGELGQEMKFNIRGAGTIGSGSNDGPLVLIDGVVGYINSLNPNDIESISVLKDAASASIYGARAAFGVILVTTKSGGSGKARVSYSGNVRFSTATQLPDMVDSYTFTQYFNEAAVNAGVGVSFTDEAIERIKLFQQGIIDKSKNMNPSGISDLNGDGVWDFYTTSYANNDWFDVFYRDNVPSQEHNISLSGGTDKISYMVSSNYLATQGILAVNPDKFNRITTNAKIGAQLAPWFHFDYSVKYYRENYNRPTYLRNNGGGLFYHNIARRWPTIPAYDEFGHPTQDSELQQLIDGGNTLDRADYMTHLMQFIFEPVKDWHINVNGSYYYYNGHTHSEILPVYSWNPDGSVAGYMANGDYGPGISNVGETARNTNHYTLNITTDYSKSFGNHNIKLMAGFNGEYEKYETFNASGSGLISDRTPYLKQTTDEFKVGGYASEYALAGFFGRINYDYDERYLLEMNFRYDGTSIFVGDKQWGFFPSFSAGWNIAKEPWMKNANKVVQLLKLRGSWGQLGNSNLSNKYPFYQTMGVGSSNSNWLINGKRQNTSSMAGIVSSVLTWETVRTLDFGLDFALFDNRFTGIFDWYSRQTLGMVGPAPTLPSILGASAPAVNNCDLRSNGWELELGWRDHIGEFSYGAKLVLSDCQSVVTDYPNETKSLSQSYYSGRTMGEIWGYTTHGIAQSQEEMDAWLAKNKPTWGSSWAPGDIMYCDLNGDGVVNSGNNTLGDSGDLTVIGNTTPRYNYGITLDAAWKGVDFSIFFQGVGKRDYSFSSSDVYFWGTCGNLWQACCFKEHLDYWSPDNPDGYYPRPLLGNITKNLSTQTRYLQDASFCRIKNLQLGYTFPSKWMEKAKISTLRVYFSIDNLCTFTKLASQFDPEALSGYWASGKTYPLTRTWSFGVNVNF